MDTTLQIRTRLNRILSLLQCLKKISWLTRISALNLNFLGLNTIQSWRCAESLKRLRRRHRLSLHVGNPRDKRPMRHQSELRQGEGASWQVWLAEIVIAAR